MHISYTEYDFIKLYIEDYISLEEYINGIEDSISNMISNSIIWNSEKQKVNKGVIYVIKKDNMIFNILIDGNNLTVLEREVKDNIIEKVIRYSKIDKDYSYSLLKHDLNGSTFYTKFFSKKKNHLSSFFNLSSTNAYNDIKDLITDLESIYGIESILDINILKLDVLEDLKRGKSIVLN